MDLSVPHGTSLADYRLVAQTGVSGTHPTAFAARDDLTPPAATHSITPTLKKILKAYTFEITYHDNAHIDTDTLDSSDLVVTGPDGFSRHADLIRVVRGRHGSTRIATYAVRGPEGRWDAIDHGSYEIHLRDGEVRDAAGNAALGRRIGTFTVAIPTPPQTSSITATPNAAAFFQMKRKISNLLES
jgi:hypothetical protein